MISGRIFDRLVARYGRETIFRDIDDIPFGVDFRTHVDQVLGSTDVVIAIVGPTWAGPSASQSRLSNEADPVRVEIETALRKKVPLIPVLVLGAVMPTVTQLPESLKDFAYRNAVQLDAGQDFDVHMARLIRALDGVLGLAVEAARPLRDETTASRGQAPLPKRHDILIVGATGVALAVALTFGWHFGLDRQFFCGSTIPGRSERRRCRLRPSCRRQVRRLRRLLDCRSTPRSFSGNRSRTANPLPILRNISANIQTANSPALHTIRSQPYLIPN